MTERRKARAAKKKATAKISPVAERAIASEPSREEIEQRAYYLYLARGCAEGQEIEHWLEAERELYTAREKGSAS